MLDKLEECGFIHSYVAYGKESQGILAYSPFTVDKAYVDMLNNKIGSFRNITSTRCSLPLTMITTYGVLHNEYWNMVQNEVTMDDLFGNSHHI